MHRERIAIRPFLFAPPCAGLIAFVWVCFGLGRVGVTIDEPLDVAPGRHYWTTLFERGAGSFSAEGAQAMFGGNPDHPPLARWILGAFSHLLEPIQPVLFGFADPTGLYVVSARFASAVAFALTVALIGRYAGRRWGTAAGWTAAFAYMTLPHVFGHAHLAALESVLNLTWLSACLAWMSWHESPSAKRSLWAGFFTGLACLTKLQGWLLFPWILVILAWNRHSLRARFVGAIGASTAPLWWFAGWPWMWYDSADRLRAYFASSVERTHLKVLYFGQIRQDNELPWHYAPFQWFAAVGPIVLVLFGVGCYAVWRGGQDRSARLWTLIPAGMVVLFTMPLARYDTDRLFLVQWPAVAILSGAGLVMIRTRLPIERIPVVVRRAVSAAVLVCLMLPCLKTSPLSYVSPQAGGLHGFESFGMDLNYWGDAVDAVLVSELSPLLQSGEVVAVVPTLAQSQAAFLTPPWLMRQGRLFRDQGDWRDADWLIVYRRSSYWPQGLAEWIETRRPAATRSRDGVWLAGIWPGPKNRSKR
jgi:4-amino-4-deoxy-L-arabinose transferase-like glycosyltransferase